ncbi:MAG: hypothetical protein KF866_01400 [Phycisphaeraceae bacterium]|nr:hypothetical protein [Phycisphaeraceae bacterium]MCW5755003.1 hypothetical protein [Phycisphaeraceae bacterium]
MDQIVVPILIVLVIALAIVGAVYAHRKEQERLRQLEALAEELSLRFDRKRHRNGDHRHKGFRVFAQGHSRLRMNTLEGPLTIHDRPYPLTCGDYQYKITTSTGKTTTTTTYTFSYLLYELPFPRVPDLNIRAETFLDKIAGAVGFDDINFESAEFSRRFHVKSPDKRFAYAVIHPRMMEYLMANTGYTLELRDRRLLITRGVTRWNPAAYREAIHFGRGFLDLWPGHLVRELAS